MKAQILTSFLIGSNLVNAYALKPRVISPGEKLDKYDYVIIGGGHAGGVVAARLAENSRASVLVIEAGQVDQAEEIAIVPGKAGALMRTKYDWNFTTVPMEFAGNRAIDVPAAKVIGGGSVMNGMAFDRGAASDYDAWNDLGNKGWGWKDLLPYFKKAENFHPPPKEIAEKYDITYDPSAHGFNGPIHASYPPFQDELSIPWIKGLNGLGIPKERDGHNGRALNVFWSPNSLDPKNLTRSYVKPGYYLPATKRNNFHALLGNTVTKVVTKKVGKKVVVTEIEYTTGPGVATQKVKVGKEAIVSAGAIGSPRLLQISGIGPSGLSKSLGVTPVVDLPGVGSNYQDHSWQFVFNALTNYTQAPAPTDEEAAAEYYANKTGPWTRSGPTLFAFLPFKTFSENATSILNSWKAQSPAAHLATGSGNEVVKGYEEQVKILSKRLGTNLMAMTEYVWIGGSALISAQHPFSRGTIKAASTDVFQQPLIDFRYGSNPLDYKVLADSIRWFRKALQTAPELAALGPLEFAPGPDVQTDEQFAANIAGSITTMFHSCCTNPMQPKKLGGVVDDRLKVYGVDNLRVVDASIIPLIPATHIQATVYAIAEKAADLILKGR